MRLLQLFPPIRGLGKVSRERDNRLSGYRTANEEGEYVYPEASSIGKREVFVIVWDLKI